MQSNQLAHQNYMVDSTDHSSLGPVAADTTNDQTLNDTIPGAGQVMRLSNILGRSKGGFAKPDGRNATYRSIRVGRSNNSEMNAGRVISAQERHAVLMNNVMNQSKNNSIALNSKLMTGYLPTR